MPDKLFASKKPDSEKKAAPKSLTQAGRLKKVLLSQGLHRHAAVTSLPEPVTNELASLCSESGELDKETRQRVSTILDKYYDAHKATVETTDRAQTVQGAWVSPPNEPNSKDTTPDAQ